MHKIKLFNTVPVLKPWMVEKQAEKQIHFLKAIHPQLSETSWSEGRVELRPIKRDLNLNEYIRSFGAWRMMEKDKDELIKFLHKINGKGIDLYYSAFTFDYSLTVERKDGKKYDKGKLNNQNALFTNILPMDFDNMSEEEFIIEKERLSSIGIETLDIFTGHGFQSLILLNHRVYDKDIFNKFTTLMIQKGFRVDEAVKDTARMLRMPYSFNCKALDKNSKYHNPVFPEIVATTDIAWTEERYHLVDIFEKINSLPNILPVAEEIQKIDNTVINNETMTGKQHIEKNEKEFEVINDINLEDLKNAYNMVVFETLQEPIQKMLSGTVEGLRNTVMFFLIPFFKNTMGYNINVIKEIMILWGERCSPVLGREYIEKETKRIYLKKFDGIFGKYTKDLRKVYGYLDFSKYDKRNKVVISNSFFDEIGDMSDGAVKIYFFMKYDEVKHQKKQFSIEDIENTLSISSSTCRRNIKDLLKQEFLCKKRMNRRKGEAYSYYINPYFSSGEGFTIVDIQFVEKMLRELTGGEIKLLGYLLMMSNTNSCWASQKYLAKKIGKKGHSSISKMTSSLNEKGFIIKKTIEKDGIKHSFYTINHLKI